MNKIKKIIAILLITALLFNKGSYFVYAEAQSADEAQPAQETEKTDKAPKPDKGEAEPAVEAQPAQEAPNPSPEPTPIPEQTVVNTQESEVGHSGVSSDGNVGDTTIDTGDANNAGGIYNLANSNLSGSGGALGGSSGTSISNTGNGAGSDNNGSAIIVNNNNTDQYNSVVIINNANQSAITGDNSASKNVGDSSITTGDANVSGTVITAANTNVDGVAVSEFNIVDDHNGDFLLDFGANCISGCGGGPIAVENSNNGANSNNTGEVNNTTNNNTNQLNDGTVTNNIDFLADSGHNATDKNTGGTSEITTGDASVAANLLTFLNNNIAGGVMFGVVNIFGNLIGDIILPDNVFDQFACGACGGDTNITNSNNGSGSDNNALVNDITNNNVFQSNDATIENNLTLSAESGKNSASKNNQGDVNITTGSTIVDASILNIANMNLLGSDMWLVLINEAGNWIGKLFGAPTGSILAGSNNAEFALSPNGQINVTNADNGAGSTNNGTVNNTTNNNLNQTNTANVVNNVNLFANTGKNSADKNNGDVNITTGDAQAIANIVNFVNNNIAGGRLLVTFVNVFGSWTGDFLTPGSKKDSNENQVLAQGGTGNSSSNNNNSQAAQVSSSNNSGSAVTKGDNVVAAAGFFGGGSRASSVGNGSSVDVKVAGANTAALLAGLTKIVDSNNKTKINLAWLLLATPVLALGILARKRFLRKPSLPAGRSALRARGPSGPAA